MRWKPIPKLKGHIACAMLLRTSFQVLGRVLALFLGGEKSWFGAQGVLTRNLSYQIIRSGSGWAQEARQKSRMAGQCEKIPAALRGGAANLAARSDRSWLKRPSNLVARDGEGAVRADLPLALQGKSESFTKILDVTRFLGGWLKKLCQCAYAYRRYCVNTGKRPPPLPLLL